MFSIFSFNSYLCVLHFLFLVFLFVDLGTSGKPKGVTISHASLLVQSLAKLSLVGYREDDVRLSWETFFTEKVFT